MESKKGIGSNVINLRTGGRTSVNVEAEGAVVVKPRIVKQVTQPPAGSISSGQLAEVNAKIDEWVNVSGIVGGSVNHGGAKKRFLRQAVSMGKAGAPYMSHYPACDFERGMKLIRAEIGKLRNSNRYLENDPEAARKSMIADIKIKAKAKGVSDSQYREYLLAIYGVDSSTLLDIGQLQELREYARSAGRFIIQKPKEKNVQERRIDSLIRLMDKRNGVGFLSHDDAHAALISHDHGLFYDLGSDAFLKFWKGQKVTALPKGRRRSSKESPVA